MRAIGRREALRAALGVAGVLSGSALLAACGDEAGTTTGAGGATTTRTDPLAPPSPVRTPTPDAPVRRVVALSSADLDVLVALDVDPAAAWAQDGTAPRPWRRRPAPSAPAWDGPGPPTLRALLPLGAGAFALAAADVSREQLRGYEQLATVIADPAGRPGWRDHLELVAAAVDRDPRPAEDRAGEALDGWVAGQRRLGVTTLAVVLATGARPDTPVATLAADAPLAREVRDLGFDVLAHDEAVPYRDLRRPGVQVVRVDPRDADLVAAVRQPSVLSLPWALEALVRNRRPSAPGGRR